MTTSYRKHDDQPKAVEVKPVVVGSQPAANPKPKKCVSVIVERTGLGSPPRVRGILSMY